MTKAFWSSEKLKVRIPKDDIVKPYSEVGVKHGAYELTLGPEAYITSTPTKQILAPREQLTIPPGQFGLLLTEEIVTIPLDAIGFISIRAKWKFGGLINVSGFHVDPGFSGRLKFSIYNAGPRNLCIARGDRVFLIWLSDLDQITTDGYDGNNAGQNEITSDDINRMQGDVASPGALKNQIDKFALDYDSRLGALEDKLKSRKEFWNGLSVGILILVITLVAEQLIERGFAKKQPEPEIKATAPADPTLQSPLSNTVKNTK